MIKLQFPDYFEEFNRYCKEPSWNNLLPVITKRKYSLLVFLPKMKKSLLAFLPK